MITKVKEKNVQNMAWPGFELAPSKSPIMEITLR